MKVADAFPHDLYRFLVRSLRDKDAGGVLERYLHGPQGVWEDFQGRIEELDQLHNVDTIPDVYLSYLKHHVGWTAETDNITESLTPTDLRKLIRLSVAFWKTRGTELGIKDAIRLLVGRDVVIWNWFHSRWIVGESGFWRLGMEADSFALGGYGGERGEYTSVLWVMNEPGVDADRQLIRDLVNLHRPLQEQYLIAYAGLVDDFRLGRSKWVQTADAVADAIWDSENYRLILPPGATVRANVNGIRSWRDVVWRNQIQFGGIEDSFYILINVNQDEDRYEVTFNQSGTLSIFSVFGGVSSLIDTYDLPHAFPLGEPQVVGVNAIRELGGRLRISVVVYEVEELIVSISDPSEFIPSGEWRIASSAGAAGDITVDNVIAYPLPLFVDVVSGAGVVAAAPAAGRPAPNVLLSYDFASVAGWSLSGLWHQTGFRYFSQTKSLYYGSGEFGYTGWGTPGHMGGAPNVGYAISPQHDLSAWTADRFRIFLDFRQWLDIRPGAGDQARVEVLVAGVSVLTFSKAQVIAAGPAARFEITSVAAGTAGVSFRFSMDTVTTPSAAREGWYVDDLRILVEEV